MEALKLSICFIFFVLIGGNAFSQTCSFSNSDYLEINYNEYDFYLINADSSRMLRFFEVDQTEKLYLLAFDWKYRFFDAEIVCFESDTVTQKVKYSARCIACPVYISVKFRNNFPEKIVFRDKDKTKQFIIELNEFKNFALKLKPFVNENGYIKWESLPAKLW